MARTRLYSIISIACLAGFAWIMYLHTYSHSSPGPGICMIKRITSIPCPSCGTSRSVLLIMNGDYVAALKMNPFGFLISLIILISPVWIFMDMMTKRNSFLLFYKTVETFIRIKWVAILMIGLVAANWIWNIMKGL